MSCESILDSPNYGTGLGCCLASVVQLWHELLLDGIILNVLMPRIVSFPVLFLKGAHCQKPWVTVRLLHSRNCHVDVHFVTQQPSTNSGRNGECL